MEEVEYVATGNVAVRGGEAGDIRIGSGECGGAQIEARWEALDDAANEALRVAGLDLALDRHGKLAEWALGSEHMGDVAESVLVLIEPAIRGNVDAPARHVLAIVVARGQPQHLDDAGGGRLVAVGDQMRDADTHERGQPVCEARTYRTACAWPNPVAASCGLQHPRYIRYCSVMAAPRRLLLSMNSVMNSCIPCWKISSMRLFSSWARTARAWRWAGPWRP